MFNRYKSDECLDHTDVQNDFSVIGNEFINFISTVATCRIIKKAHEAGLFDHMTYGELMDDLSSAWRRTDAPSEPPGLSKPEPKPEPKKCGRPGVVLRTKISPFDRYFLGLEEIGAFRE